jgi:prolyl-tRNA synthetase
MAESPITPRQQDFAAWYQDVVIQGDMAEPAEIVKGCMVITAVRQSALRSMASPLD